MDDARIKAICKEVRGALNMGYTLKECASIVGIHRITLWRWLKLFTNENVVYGQYTVEEVEGLILEFIPIFGYGRDWGIRMIQARLKTLEYKIPRRLVRDAIENLVPGLLAARARRCLSRRIYDVTEPMHVWHMDSYDKLANYGFRVHGAIDGATHFIVYMKVALNKKARTIYEGYKTAVQKYGHPLLIRSDYASEHVLVQRNLERARPDSNCFRMGSSVHNQRIEAFWGQLKKQALGYFKEMFWRLSYEEGFLQMNNPLHRYSIVTIMFPFIENAVKVAICTWNAHTVRAVHERGINRPSHIPEMAFQAAEREAKIILPSPYAEGSQINFEEEEILDLPANDYWNYNDDHGNFEDGIKDLDDENLRYIRNVAYDSNEDIMLSEADKLRLHLSLSLECENSTQASLGLASYVEEQLDLHDISEERRWILNLLQQTLQMMRDS